MTSTISHAQGPVRQLTAPNVYTDYSLLTGKPTDKHWLTGSPTAPLEHGKQQLSGKNFSDTVLGGALLVGGISQVAGRALSTVRIVAAFPTAKANGKLPLWAFELAVQKSTIDVVPPKGGYLNLWGKAFATSQALKGFGALATIVVAGSATSGALNKGGPAALGNSVQGRTGVAATIASVATLGFMGVAATHARDKGSMAMFKNMFTDEMLGRWKVVGPALAAWTFIGANQLGYFDGFNEGETRTNGEIMHDSFEKTKDVPGEVKAKLASYFD